MDRVVARLITYGLCALACTLLGVFGVLMAVLMLWPLVLGAPFMPDWANVLAPLVAPVYWIGFYKLIPVLRRPLLELLGSATATLGEFLEDQWVTRLGNGVKWCDDDFMDPFKEDRSKPLSDN